MGWNYGCSGTSTHNIDKEEDKMSAIKSGGIINTNKAYATTDVIQKA